MGTITVKYTCRACGLFEQELDVPERQRAIHPDFWAEITWKRVDEDHSQRRPHCSAAAFDLHAPAKNNDAEMIGRNSK